MTPNGIHCVLVSSFRWWNIDLKQHIRIISEPRAIPGMASINHNVTGIFGIFWFRSEQCDCDMSVIHKIQPHHYCCRIGKLSYIFILVNGVTGQLWTFNIRHPNYSWPGMVASCIILIWNNYAILVIFTDTTKVSFVVPIHGSQRIDRTSSAIWRFDHAFLACNSVIR